MKTLGITQSVCPTCRGVVPAKVMSIGDEVYFDKFCPEHGSSRSFVRSGVDDYLRSLRCVKPAWVPREFTGDSALPCPEGCGFCSRHEQHLCLPIVEVTTRCDLGCPICLVDAGWSWDMTREEFQRVLDGLVRAEKQVDVLNLSGGEPLLHPHLVAFLDEALSRPEIVRVSISTNGLSLLRNPSLLGELRDRNVVVSLQFDGFDDGVYQVLRGRPLVKEKLRVLDMLAEKDISTSLTVTAAAGLIEEQIPRLLDHFFSQPHVISMMLQPLAFTGRGAALTGQIRRLTLPGIIRLLGAAGDRRVVTSDFTPLPCSHPLCFALAYYLITDEGGTVSLNRLVDATTMLDLLANRTVFGLDEKEHETLKALVYELWSGPAATVPESDMVVGTLRNILRELSGSFFDPRQAFYIAERRIKSIFIHAFQDADTFDLARVRRCCNAYVQVDGTLVPVCVHNVLRRKGK